MLGVNWNSDSSVLNPVKSSNSVQFDNDALQKHKQAGQDREEIINSIKTMLDYNPELDTSEADKDIPEFESEEVKNDVAKELLGTEELKNVQPMDNSTHISFDNSALDNHRQNGIKGTLKQFVMNNIGGMLAL